MVNYLKQIVKSLIPPALCRVRLPSQAGSSVLVTFDDGPHPDVTPAVLDRLRRFQAKAVFFVVGNRVEQAPHLLERIVAEGHWLGNHTYSHPNDRCMGFREYRRDLQRCQEIVLHHSGVLVQLHRPPGGQITMASILAPRCCGLRTVNWSRSSDDWQLSSDEEAVARADRMAEKVRERDILVFHDEKRHTLVLLDRLLPALVAKGLSLSPKYEHLI